MKKTIAILLALLTLFSLPAALAAKSKATPTPAPMEIGTEIVDPPEAIQRLLEVAYNEWTTVNGKDQGKKNKYTTWFNNYDWGKNTWCAGFVTWCMLEANVPQEEQKTILSWEEGPVSGILHCKAAAPARLLEAYSHMQRTTMIP